MYVVNGSDLHNSQLFTCGTSMAKYLIKKGHSPISNIDGKYCFSKTQELEGTYKKAPFHLKMLEGW